MDEVDYKEMVGLLDKQLKELQSLKWNVRFFVFLAVLAIILNIFGWLVS